MVCRDTSNGHALAYPDTLVGTDSHTTMVNGLGVVGWGVGGHRGGGGDARAADLHAHSRRDRLPAGGRVAGRHDGDRSRADHHRAAAAARRRREVRRVLRAGARVAHAGRPGDARQHVAGVRIHRGDLPHRWDDARLPCADGPGSGAGGSGRGVRQDAGSLRLRVGRRFVHGRRRARPRDRRAQHRRAEAPAGPGAAAEREVGVRGGARRAGRRPRTARRREGPGTGGGRGAARGRRRRHRSHHELHEHVEPQRDDRGRTARAEGGGARSSPAAVGEDQPGPRLAGGHGVPAGRGPPRAAGRARLRPRRLRLHHLHRQQRPAARCGRRPRSRNATWW